MLGMYLKFLEQDLIADGSIIDGDFLNIPEEIDNILKLNRKKTEKLDYIILFVWHLISFVGPDKTISFMKENDCKFQKIFEKLDDHFKRTLVGNFLNYCLELSELTLSLFLRCDLRFCSYADLFQPNQLSYSILLQNEGLLIADRA